MSLEAASISTRQSPFEVVGDELDGLLAHDVSSAQCQHRSGLLYLGFEDLPYAGTSSMQQYPLISTSNPQSRTRLVVRESLDIAQDDDLALTCRQVVERGFEDRYPRSGIESVFAVLPPPFKWISPLALSVKAGRIDRMQRFDGHVGTLPRAS